MTVNVSLCGSIPRSQMNFRSTKRLRELNNVKRNPVPNSINQFRSSSKSSESSVVASKALFSTTSTTENVSGMPSTKERLCIPRQVSQETISLPPPAPIIDPPSWAVAAKGESRLEPVCESLNLQSPVDLTSKAVFRVGRSQNSDVQLLHCTSSRRHAILFHHPNGSCYVVDCGSAHGTFVNGIRVKTDMQTQNADGSSNSSGIILPHRVKKGALIRFGGPGAPSFILKSFSVGLDSLVQNLEEEKKQNSSMSWDRSNNNSGHSPSTADSLLALNTRLNAVGSAASSLSSRIVSLSLTSARLHAQLDPLQSSGISFLKKRSIVSFDEENDVEPELPCYKKMKMSIASGDTSFGDSGVSIAIVSPMRQKSTLDFDFSKIERPVVSPTPIEMSNEQHTLKKSKGLKSILTNNSLTLPSTRRTKRRVIFSENKPDVR